MKFARSGAAGFLVSLGLWGCAAGPDYVRPNVETPMAYKEAANWKVAEPRDGVNRGNWWEIFGDARLNTLMKDIDVSNQNLRIAAAQFRQAQALARSARAGLFPTVDGNLSLTRSRSPTGAIGGTTAGRIVSTRSASVTASWEADFWGRLSRTIESSEATAQASAADLAAARLSIQAEIALNYFQLHVLDMQKQLFDDTVAALKKSLQLTKNRYAVGVAGKVDVVQADTQLKSTEAQAVDIGVQRAQLEHAIAILIGRPPASFSISAAPLGATMPHIPLGLPSELLERRPDIAAAERRVAAANAQVGVAQSAFFPSVTLSASGGFRAADPAVWLTTPSRFWSIGPAIAQTLFDAGRRRALTDQAIAAYDASVATYRQTVLASFQEVEDNLAALRILEQESRVQEDAVRAARESLELTNNQYKAGTISYLNVAVVQTNQLNNERTAVAILGRQLTAAVQLIRALGGGWHAPDTAPRTSRR